MVVMHVLIALIVSLLMHAAVGAPPSSDPFRPPMTPLVTFGPMHQIFMLGNITSQPLPSADASDRAGKYWSGSPMGLNVMLRLQSSTGTTAVFQLLGNASFDGIPYAELDGYPEVTPLVTHLRFLIPNIPSTIAPAGAAAVADVRFVHLKVPDHPSLMQLPLVYIEAQVSCPLCTSSVTTSLYIDMNAYNVMHLGADEVINGTSFASSTTAGTIHIAKLGTSKQPVLKSFGDDFMLDWGYLYLSTTPDDASTHTSSSATATNASAARNAFMRGDATLPPNDPNLPQLASSGYPLIAVMTTFALNTNAPVHFTVGYDEQGMQYYFGDTLYGAWSQGVSSFEALIEAAQVSYAQNRATVQDFDTALMNEMSTRISPHYARIGALAYRQTFAAIEFTHSNRYQEDWAFLKEISSDGDINTMDVIFPASPLLLFVAPRVVKQLLLPVLHYAINQTWHPYTYPFCPHQLGTYPVANITTSQQEVMPAENTGNMFLLLLAYMQQTNYTDTDWVFEGYWEVLSDWAMYMVETQLPVPPRQTCTDDFAGPLAENTNLAAKCTIALEAYAEMCDYFQRTKGGNHTPTLGWHCEVFHNLALSYAEFWTAFGVETDPVTHLNHSRLAFNQPNTWSTKYNLLWQKMLGLKRPFTNFETLAANEVAYYQTKMHTFGFPMDIRHTYQKLDWMTWGSCLSSNVTEFAELFEGIYRMANETTSRWPLTDLYDTVTADIYLSFRSRPVVGAVFAAMMLY